MRRQLWVATLTVIALAVATTGAYAHSDPIGHSTLEQTLEGGDPDERFRFLRTGPGEKYVVREELAEAKANRKNRRRSLAYLGHITDFQLSDEESPARVESADVIPPFSSAWRPQEAFVAHQVEYTIRQLNRFDRSPVRQGNGKRAELLNAVMTGDLADNAQRNETEWVVELLEGGTFRQGNLKTRKLDPNSGTNDYSETACEGMPRGSLGNPRKYSGVQDYDDYPGGAGDERFYDPNQPAGEYSDWPTYPGVLDRAQKPFKVKGLEVPSYVAFGNHDALAQGNAAIIKLYEDVATGCAKLFPPAIFPFKAGPTSSDPEALPDFTRLFERLAQPVGKQSANAILEPPAGASFVPPDENRQFVDHRQFKKLHDTGVQRDEHGFAHIDEDQLEASRRAASYYDFSPKPGLRYIVLDTVSEGGVIGDSASGNLDHPQFRWLRRELKQAQRRDELIVTFGHHATDSLTAVTADEEAPPCTTRDEHGHDVNPGCDRDPRTSTPLHHGDDLEELFHSFPNMISYVAGHSHENEVQPFKDDDGSGDFWEIKSPAVVDWPPQHRLIEVMDNRDGTLSIFGTILDHAGKAKGPKGGSADEVDDFGPRELASLGRTLSYNDPQVGPGEAEGERIDRNVELLIRDPRSKGGGGDGSVFRRDEYRR